MDKISEIPQKREMCLFHQKLIFSNNEKTASTLWKNNTILEQNKQKQQCINVAIFITYLYTQKTIQFQIHSSLNNARLGKQKSNI